MPVRESVLQMDEAWQHDENARAILRRVATHPKMSIVWDTLKKHRWDALKERRVSDDELQHFMRCACRRALLYGTGFVPMTRKKRDARARQLSDAADLCRKTVPRSKRINPALGAAAPVMARHFDAMAQLLKEGVQPPLLVENHIKDDEARAFVQALSAETKDLFGEVLYGTVATVATVALDQEISERQVRNWWDAAEKLTPASLFEQKWQN